MSNKKKITYRAVAYSAVGLGLIGSSLLVSLTANNNTIATKAKPTLDVATSNDRYVSNAGESIIKGQQDFVIRSNPSNGFNGLKTPDGKYTYVLITKKSTTALTPDQVGGKNSGIACIDNTNGTVVGTWYIPADDADSALLSYNYTTNIVFGQKKDTNGIVSFDPNKLFVLCGISNLGGAISKVFTDYNSGTKKLTTNLTFSDQQTTIPTIKIFSLDVSSPANISGTQFYNFAYPSDGSLGYAGFNKSGMPYGIAYASSTNPTGLNPAITNEFFYGANGVSFSGIKRLGEISNGGPSFTSWQNGSIYAFGSYLTYLTYGQNFAYHLGKTYANAPEGTPSYNDKDEFIMTTSFVNVDENIGGLYSATVENSIDGKYPVDSSDTPVSAISSQGDWPVPFGYAWLLASIAKTNGKTQHKTGDLQYSYVDAKGTTHRVNWGDKAALPQSIIDFFNDDIFIQRSVIVGGPESSILTSLWDSLMYADHFGANWGATTGYIIFNPTNLVTTLSPFASANINEYRYYYVGEMANRPFDDNNDTIFSNQYSGINLMFTNVLATDQLTSPANRTISYLIGVAYANVPANFASLLTADTMSMFCYDWESLSNDDGDNGMIISLASEANLTYGNYTYINSYGGQGNPSLKDSFTNWNLVFLGAPSANTSMDSSFTLKFSDTISQVGKGKYASIGADPSSGIIWGGIDSEMLGRRMTYLRRKVSFVIHPYEGFVYFTAGTGLAWRNGLSFWDVRSFNDFNNGNLKHNFTNAGTIYLAEPVSEWTDFDQAVWDIKEIGKQPIGNGGSTMAFITSKGIYTVAGAWHTSNIFESSINNFLAHITNSATNVNKPAKSELLHAVQFTKFASYDAKKTNISIIPDVVILDPNTLWVLGADNVEYSVQQNTDYLVYANDPTQTSGVLPFNVNNPKDLARMPAAKPLLPISTATAIKANVIDKTLLDGKFKESGTTIDAIKKDSLQELFIVLLKLLPGTSASALPANSSVAQNYNIANGAIVNSASADNTIANINIPIIYSTISMNVVYYAPVVDNQGNYQFFYQLKDLKPSDYAPPIVILKTADSILSHLQTKKITAEALVRDYGGTTYDSTKAEYINSIFVDTTETQNYINKHPGFLGNNKFKYWLVVSMNPDNTAQILLTMKYNLNGSTTDWIEVSNTDSNGAGMCFANLGTANPRFEISFAAYSQGIIIPPAAPDRTPVIIGAVVAALVAVSVALGLGIGLPMRKQHKINVLNSKITNKRIDKLSSAVSASFKKVIETTAAIGKDVSQLKSAVHRSLGAAKTPVPPARPVAAPSAPSAPRPPQPTVPVRPAAPTKPVAAPSAPTKPVAK